MSHPLSPLSEAERNSRTPSHEVLEKLDGGFPTTSPTKHAMTDNTENFTIHEDPLADSAFVTAADMLKTPAMVPLPRSRHATPSIREGTTPQRTPLGELSPREQEETSILAEEEDDVFDDALQAPCSGRSSPAASPNKDFDLDNTCLSTFSMVPNVDMTKFARLQYSPTKSSGLRDELATPRAGRPTTPGTVRPGRPPHSEASPTPRRGPPPPSDDATTQLLEFTGPIDAGRATTSRSAFRGNQYSLSKARHTPHRQAPHPGTSSRNAPFANLLDFDLPPAPTPRSIPTITARELESLKAGFLSEISSLRANLSGKEAEIRSLVVAKDDAEQRNGKAQEELRDVRNARAALEDEKAAWEKRDKELKDILRGVKDELWTREREREELAGKLDASEVRVEAAEARTTEAESKLSGLHAANPAPSPTDGTGAPTAAAGVEQAVGQAVDKVAHDLHKLYREKHENKVRALKESYAARWDRRVRDLEREIEELRTARDATMSGVVPSATAAKTKDADLEALRSEHAAERQLLADANRAAGARADELGAQTARLEAELDRVRSELAALRKELEASRQENGDLVAAVEQMLQLENGSGVATQAPAPAAAPLYTPAATTIIEEQPARPQSRTGGLPKPSGLRGPGFGGESRIGTVKRSVSGTVRSGIMSNIERMGRGRE